MGRVSVERSSRIRTPRGRDRRAVPAIPAGQSPRRPRTCFWAGGPFQQLRRLPVDNEFLLELSDPPPRRSQFSPLRRREPWLDAAVDALLSPPVIHGLVADPEILGDVRDPAAARDEVKDAPTKLRWVTPSSHAVLRVARQHDIQVIRLHETRGTLSPCRPDHCRAGPSVGWSQPSPYFAGLCAQRGSPCGQRGRRRGQRGSPRKSGVSTRLEAIFDPSRIQN